MTFFVSIERKYHICNIIVCNKLTLMQSKCIKQITRAVNHIGILTKRVLQQCAPQDMVIIIANEVALKMSKSIRKHHEQDYVNIC